MRKIIIILLSILLVNAIPSDINASTGWTIVINGSRHNRCSADMRSVSVKDDGDQWIIKLESWNNWKLSNCGDFVMMFLYINTSATRDFNDANYAITFMEIDGTMLIASMTLKGGRSLPFRRDFDANRSTGTITIKKSDLRAPDARFSLLFRIAEINREIEIAPPNRQMAIYRSTAKQPEAKLSISKRHFDFGTIPKDRNTTDSFDLINEGVGNIDVRLSSSSNIHINMSQITLGDFDRFTISLEINPRRLSARSYEETINIQSSDQNFEVTVKFTILPDPKLSVDKKVIDFGRIFRNERAVETVVISNENPGDIRVSISTDARWVTINRHGFTSNRGELQVSVNTERIPSNRQTGHVIIDSDGGSEKIVVHAEVIDSFLCLTEEINFGSVDIDLKEEQTGRIAVQNTSDREVKVVAQTEANWINIKEREIMLSPLQTQQFEVGINFNHLKEPNKIYRDKIIVISEHDTYEVHVSINLVQTPPELTWVSEVDEKKKIIREIYLGQTAEFIVEVKNTGSGLLEVTTSIENNKDRQFRMFTLPFSLKANESEEIIVRFDSSRRSPGTYQATLRIASNGGNMDIPMIVEVLENPTITIQLFIGRSTAYIEEKELQLDAPPYISRGTTMVPLRFIGEAFDAEVEWLPMGAGRIIVKLSDKTIRLDIGSTTAYIDDKAHTLSVAPEIRNGRTFVPVRFISEGFGAKVEWDAGLQRVTIVFTITPD